MEIPNSHRRIVEAELNPEETVLWVGRPAPGRAAKPYVALVFVGLIWTISSASSVLTDRPQDWVSMLPSGIFVLFGVGIMLSPLRYYYQALATVYVVTDARVIIVAGRNAKSSRSYYAADIRGVRRVELRDGTGDVSIGAITTETGSDESTQDVELLGISRPRDVERMIRAHILKDPDLMGNTPSD